MARPSLYETEWKDRLALVQGWARDGLSNVQIAHNMGIGETTLYEWQIKHAEFAEAIKKGKEVVDREVENALLKRANGYQMDLMQQKVLSDGRIVEYKQRIHVQPDVTAQKFWLINRKPEQWRDKTEVDTNVSISQKLEDFL